MRIRNPVAIVFVGMLTVCFEAKADVTSILSTNNMFCTNTCSIVTTMSLEVDNSEIYTAAIYETLYLTRGTTTIGQADGNWEYFYSSLPGGFSWGGSLTLSTDYTSGGQYCGKSHSNYALIDGQAPEPDVNLDDEQCLVVEPCGFWGNPN